MRRSSGRRPPGRARGAAGSGLLLGAVCLGLFGIVALTPVPGRPHLDAGWALDRLFAEGPPPGRWEVESNRGRSTWIIAEHPDRSDCRLVGRVTGDEGTPHLRVRPGGAVARRFLGGDPVLFRKNYRLESSVETDYMDDGRPVLRRRWVPRHDLGGGDTARWMWFDARTQRLVRVEDRSYADHVVRAMQRIGPVPADLAVPDESPCGVGPASRREPRPGDVAAAAPFPVLRPTRLPPGFELIAAGYREWPLGEAADGGERPRVHMAHLFYSDGFASISIGCAPAADMDAVEEAVRNLRERSEEPGRCPTLPDSSGSVPMQGVVIRRRVDRCRTVLRRDDLDGVSVSLLGRNELEETEYHRMIASLVLIEPARRSDGDAAGE